MFFYILLFVIYVYIALKDSMTNNVHIGALLLVVLCFFSAFRGENVGTDTIHYLNFGVEVLDFDTMIKRPEFIYYSFGNFLLIKGISMKYLILFFSIITFSFLYLSARRTNTSITLVAVVFLLLFYFHSFNIARQITAASIVLYAYTFVDENSVRKRCCFFLFVALAILLHASSMLAIIVYFLRNIRFSPNLIIGLMLGFFFLNALIPINIMTVFEKISPNSFYALKYADVAGIYKRSLIGILVDFINMVIMVCVFYLQTKGKKTSFSDNLFVLSILLQFLSVSLDSDVGRVVFIFSIYQVLYLSKCFEQKAMVSDVKITFVCWIIFNAFFVLYNAAIGYGAVVPYTIDFKF